MFVIFPRKEFYWWVTELPTLVGTPQKERGRVGGTKADLLSEGRGDKECRGLHWVHIQLAICCTNRDTTVEMGTDGPHRMNSCYYSFTTQSSLLLQFHRIITRLLRYYKFHKDVSRHNISKLGIMFTLVRAKITTKRQPRCRLASGHELRHIVEAVRQ